MNQQERQALQEKHKSNNDGWCLGCNLPFPCDAIEVLDAWEKQNEIIQDLCRSKKLYDDDYVREAIGEITK